MREELGRITLKNEYTIYEINGGYEVTSSDEKGQKFSQFFLNSIVEEGFQEIPGGDWKVDEVASMLHSISEQSNWPINYGYKFRYFVQGILLILVSLGRAELCKEGRGFVYTVHGS